MNPHAFPTRWLDADTARQRRPEPVKDWRQVEVERWTAAELPKRGWPADLAAAGVDLSVPVYPAWHPDSCGHPVVVPGADELTLPCTLKAAEHIGSGHQVWSTTRELLAEAAPDRRVEHIEVERPDQPAPAGKESA